eukprot:3105276-Amphidinium_carterae.3
MWAAQCRFAKIPILAVTPAKPDLVNYPVHRRVLKFHEKREGVEDRVVWLNSYVSQLTYCQIPEFHTQEVIVAKTARQSVVVKGYVDKKTLDESKSTKFLSRGKNAAKEVLDELIPAKARTHLLDVWGVREGDHGRCLFTCRVAEPKVDSFMTLSGAGAVWFDTPNEHYSADEVSLTWLKTPDEGAKEARARAL